jgi:hypothetical protein
MRQDRARARARRRGTLSSARFSGKRPEERGQVVGVVVDVIRRFGVGRHMHRAHPHRVRRGEVAGVILEHRGRVGSSPSVANTVSNASGRGLGV